MHGIPQTQVTKNIFSVLVELSYHYKLKHRFTNQQREQHRTERSVTGDSHRSLSFLTVCLLLWGKTKDCREKLSFLAQLCKRRLTDREDTFYCTVTSCGVIAWSIKASTSNQQDNRGFAIKKTTSSLWQIYNSTQEYKKIVFIGFKS